MILQKNGGQVGQTISHYKVLEKLGEGGMGIVYKAEDTKLKRTVALKFLPHHLLANEEDKTRFLHEAQAASSLSHPNIMTIHEIDEVEDPDTAGRQTFIAMEYVEGETLKDKVEKGPLKTKELLKIAIAVADGLNAAHRKDIVHRDIKSENIMISTEGLVKIMDFGLARRKGETRITKTGSTMGTLAYMSPEQVQGLEVDHRSDLWSFGVVLHEMLTGELPFRGEHEAAVIYEIVNQDPRPVEVLRQDRLKELASIVHHLLTKEPSERLGSAQELVTKLNKITPQAVKASPLSRGKEKSIAVLYFENMSSDKESDYFCSGMTEDIITDLSKIKMLKVVSRTDVLPFRDKQISTRRIGEALNVNYILEGSMRKAGERIRITSQLIDVRSGFHVWAERFDRKLENIFDLQSEVSQKIVEAFPITLSTSEREALEKRPTENLEAYDYYLRGKEFSLRRSRRDNQYTIDMFKKALTIDPDFSLAYTGLAEAYAYRYLWWDSDSSLANKAIEASQKAVQLNPALPEAHFALGLASQIENHFDEAKREYHTAIALKSDFYDAYRWLGHAYDILGNLNEAEECYRKAIKIKPYSEEPVMFLEMNRRKAGDLEESKRLQQELGELIKRKLDLNPDDTITLSRAPSAYLNLGMKEEVLKAIKRILEIDPNDGLFLFNIACAYAKMGDKKRGLRYLKRAFKSGWRVREWAQSDPDLDTLREEEEFQSLVEQMH